MMITETTTKAHIDYHTEGKIDNKNNIHYKTYASSTKINSNNNNNNDNNLHNSKKHFRTITKATTTKRVSFTPTNNNKNVYNQKDIPRFTTKKCTYKQQQRHSHSTFYSNKNMFLQITINLRVTRFILII